VSSFFIKICFLSFELTNSALDLMGFLIVLLLCQVSLNSLEVKEFSRCLKGKGEFSFHVTAVLFEFFSVSKVHVIKFVLVSFTKFEKLSIPVLVKLLILLDMCGLTLTSLVLMVESHLFHLTLEVLLLKFSNTVLSHLCLNIATFSFALFSELFSSFDEFSDVLSIHFVVLTIVSRVLQVLFHCCL